LEKSLGSDRLVVGEKKKNGGTVVLTRHGNQQGLPTRKKRYGCCHGGDAVKTGTSEPSKKSGGRKPLRSMMKKSGGSPGVEKKTKAGSPLWNP